MPMISFYVDNATQIKFLLKSDDERKSIRLKCKDLVKEELYDSDDIILKKKSEEIKDGTE